VKYAITILTIAAAGLITGCATSRPLAQEDHSSDEVVYEVFGMDCPGCHGGVEKNLVKLSGVVAASANWKQKTVTLHVAEGAAVEDAQIKQAVEDSNFTLGRQLK